MGDFVYNRSKGRIVEFAERVNANDPANAVFRLLVLAVSGIETDAVLIDKDDWAAVLSGTTNEVTNTNYARKQLDQTGGITITYDDTNDRVDVDAPDQSWTAVATGDNWSDAVWGLDKDSAAGTDADVIPMLQHDFAPVPNGSDITLQIPVGGFFRAQ